MLALLQLSAVIVKLIFNLSALVVIGAILFRRFLPDIPQTVHHFSLKLTLYCAIIAFIAALISNFWYNNGGWSKMIELIILNH